MSMTAEQASSILAGPGCNEALIHLINQEFGKSCAGAIVNGLSAEDRSWSCGYTQSLVDLKTLVIGIRKGVGDEVLKQQKT